MCIVTAACTAHCEPDHYELAPCTDTSDLFCTGIQSYVDSCFHETQTNLSSFFAYQHFTYIRQLNYDSYSSSSYFLTIIATTVI